MRSGSSYAAEAVMPRRGPCRRGLALGQRGDAKLDRVALAGGGAVQDVTGDARAVFRIAQARRQGRHRALEYPAKQHQLVRAINSPISRHAQPPTPTGFILTTCKAWRPSA